MKSSILSIQTKPQSVLWRLVYIAQRSKLWSVPSAADTYIVYPPSEV